MHELFSTVVNSADFSSGIHLDPSSAWVWRGRGLQETNLSLSFLRLAFQIAFRLSEDLTSVRKLTHVLFNEKVIK